MLKFIFVFLFLFSLLGCSTSSKKTELTREPSKLQFTYNRLKLLDLEEMMSLVDEKIDQYRETENIKALEQALLIALGRPNEDSVSGRLAGGIKVAIGNDDVWQRVLKNVVDQSLNSLNNPQAAVADQATYIFVLQTWLSEVRPDLRKPEIDTAFEKTLVKQIAEAQVQVSSEVHRETKLNLMMKLESPSQIAQEILMELTANVSGQQP